MKKTALLFIIPIFILSCSDGRIKYFSENYKVIKDFKKSVSPSSTLFIDDVLGVYNVNCVGDYVVFTTRDKTQLFYVYDENGTRITSFGHKGQGPDEFINVQNIKQVGKDNMGAFMWIDDVGQAKFKRINIDKSVTQSKTVLDTVVHSLPAVINGSVGDLLYLEVPNANNYWIVKYDVVKKAFDSKEKMYNENDNNFISLYRGFWATHPQGDKVAIAMPALNQINIFDVKSGNRSSVSVYEPSRSSELSINKNNSLPIHNYYCDISVTDKYIYGLYINQPYEDCYEVEKEMEVHVFDWEGKPVCKIILPEYIVGFSVANDNKYIYGLDNDEERVFKYDISKYLN